MSPFRLVDTLFVVLNNWWYATPPLRSQALSSLLYRMVVSLPVFQFFTKYNSYSIPLTILPVIVKFVSGTDLYWLTSLPFCLLYAHNLQALLSHQLCDFSTSSGHTSDIECCYFNFSHSPSSLSRTNFFSRPRPPDGSPCPFFAELGRGSHASLTGYALAWALSPLSVIHCGFGIGFYSRMPFLPLTTVISGGPSM